MSDERYCDCDRCGERYHGADIERYLREELNGRMVCCEVDKGTGIERRTRT